MRLAARLRAAGDRAVRRLREDLPSLSERTAAATVAWLIARRVADHHEPFFAPIAAFVALNTTLGDRGLNALRLVMGVIIGIVCGELWLIGLGGGWVALAVATYTACAVASAMGGPRIVLAQAAAGAMLTVAIGKPEEGANRLEDALIGVAVALMFSQLLFSPEPLALLRRSESAILTEMAATLGAAGALESADPARVERASTNLRALRDRLPELAQSRRASMSTARHSFVWWRRQAFVAAESENAAHLDLLGTSCIVLARVAIGASQAERAVIAPSLRELEDTLTDLATAPADRASRQRAAERASRLSERLEPLEAATPGSQLVAARVAIRMVVVDILAFAGAEPTQVASTRSR